MSKIYKTALGKSLDMAALRAKNEKVRAVGNMNVNARGDIIDSNNEVISDVNRRVNVMYERTMQNPAASRRSQPGPNLVSHPAPSAPEQVVAETKPVVASATAAPAVTQKSQKPTIADNLADEIYQSNPELDDDLPNPEK